MNEKDEFALGINAASLCFADDYIIDDSSHGSIGDLGVQIPERMRENIRMDRKNNIVPGDNFDNSGHRTIMDMNKNPNRGDMDITR